MPPSIVLGDTGGERSGASVKRPIPDCGRPNRAAANSLRQSHVPFLRTPGLGHAARLPQAFDQPFDRAARFRPGRFQQVPTSSERCQIPLARAIYDPYGSGCLSSGSAGRRKAANEQSARKSTSSRRTAPRQESFPPTRNTSTTAWSRSQRRSADCSSRRQASL